MPSFFLSVPFPIFFSVTPCSELHSQSLLCLMLTLHLNKTVLGEFWIWPGIFMEKLLLFPWRLEMSLSSARDMLGRDITFSLAIKVLSGLELASCPSPCFSLLTWGHMGVEGKVGASIFSTHTPPSMFLLSCQHRQGPRRGYAYTRPLSTVPQPTGSSWGLTMNL